MKATKLLMILLVLCFVSSAVYSQGLGLSVFAGYAMSAFEDQDDAAGTIPVGVRVSKQMAPKIDVGAEFLYPIGGFKFEVQESYWGQTYSYDLTINQMLIGAFAKMILSEGGMSPYAKAGVGMYMGNAKAEGDGIDEDVDIDSAIGFNVGAGINLSSKPMYIEFNYHIVSRKTEGADEATGANFWNIILGYNIK